MGLKIGEVFRDYCCIIVTAGGARAIGLVDVTCQPIDETGTAFGAAIVATECAWANGWYYVEFTPDAAGTWAVDWTKTVGAGLYTFHYWPKEFHVGAGQEADIYTRLGAPAGASVSADILAVDNLVDDLEGRLTAARAGYMDNINQAGLLQVTAARAGYLDNINQAGLLQLTAARAGYIDELAAANIPTDLTNIASKIDTVDDLIDTEVAAIDTKVTAVNTDLGDWSARANLTSLLASLGIPDVAGKDLYTCLITDRLDHGTYGLSALETLVDGIETRTNNHVQTRTWFSDYQASVTVTAAAPNLALPSVVLPNISGTITEVYAGFKFRMLENTNAGANKIDTTQYIQVQKGAGALTNCIKIVDDTFGVAATTREGGDCGIGNIEVHTTVDVFNATYNFQWTAADADLANLVFNDMQTFLIVSYY